jgi:mannose-6-phosphate isomerase-like protein (cupin superfamily)
MRRFVSLSTWAFGALMFAGGLLIGRVDRAHAADAAPPLAATIIHTSSLGAADLPAAAPGGTMQTKVVATADGATVQVQLGTVGKHFHANANEIQYIVQGQGKFWLGDSYKDVGPGDLIIIPKGTAHGGTTTAFKAIAVKTPPQAKDDIHPVQ